MSGLRFERQRYEHWIEALDSRLARINALFDWLDKAYQRHQGRLQERGFRAPEGVAIAPSSEEGAEVEAEPVEALS